MSMCLQDVWKARAADRFPWRCAQAGELAHAAASLPERPADIVKTRRAARKPPPHRGVRTVSAYGLGAAG